MEAKKLEENGPDLNPVFDSLSPESILKHTEQVKAEAEAKTVDFPALRDKYKVSIHDELKPPQIAWKTDDATLGTLGNFSMIIGKAKSRKSFFINIAVSTVLQEDLLLGQFKGELPDNQRKVLYFDTEQSKYHVQLSLKRICKQTGIAAPENLEVYGLRSLKPSQRRDLIEHIIYDTPDLGFVVIDGIRDLLTSINDEEQATSIASDLLKWTEERNIHIVTVLHQNKGDTNARGHIGTELTNKAETVLSVTKNDQDKDISIVEAEQCRNKDPEPFAFEINEEGLPVMAENFEFRTETRKNKFDLTDLSQIEIIQLLNEVYLNGKEFPYSQLVMQMKLAVKKHFNKKVGDNRIKELITQCKNEELIIQEKSKGPYKQAVTKVEEEF